MRASGSGRRGGGGGAGSGSDGVRVWGSADGVVDPGQLAAKGGLAAKGELMVPEVPPRLSLEGEPRAQLHVHDDQFKTVKYLAVWHNDLSKVASEVRTWCQQQLPQRCTPPLVERMVATIERQMIIPSPLAPGESLDTIDAFAPGPDATATAAACHAFDFYDCHALHGFDDCAVQRDACFHDAAVAGMVASDISCAVCRLMGSMLPVFAANRRSFRVQAKPQHKPKRKGAREAERRGGDGLATVEVKDEDLWSLADRLCSSLPGSSWLRHVDIQNDTPPLRLVIHPHPGVCGLECQAVKRACVGVLNQTTFLSAAVSLRQKMARAIESMLPPATGDDGGEGAGDWHGRPTDKEMPGGQGGDEARAGKRAERALKATQDFSSSLCESVCDESTAAKANGLEGGRGQQAHKRDETAKHWFRRDDAFTPLTADQRQQLPASPEKFDFKFVDSM